MKKIVDLFKIKSQLFFIKILFKKYLVFQENSKAILLRDPIFRVSFMLQRVFLYYNLNLLKILNDNYFTKLDIN